MKQFLFLIGFLSVSIYGQDIAKVDLSNPKAAIYTHLHFLEADSYQPEKAAATIQGYSKEEAIQKAILLKQILVGKGLLVDFDKIPVNPNHNDTIGYAKIYTYRLFPDSVPFISVEKINDKWYYSAETIRYINTYKQYRFGEVEKKKITKKNENKKPIIIAKKIATPVVDLPKKKTKSTTAYHQVKKGETFYSLSKKYNTTILALKKLNRLKGNIISIGQYLRVK